MWMEDMLIMSSSDIKMKMGQSLQNEKKSAWKDACVLQICVPNGHAVNGKFYKEHVLSNVRKKTIEN